jgi:hypothetical protein
VLSYRALQNAEFAAWLRSFISSRSDRHIAELDRSDNCKFLYGDSDKLVLLK